MSKLRRKGKSRKNKEKRGRFNIATSIKILCLKLLVN